MLDCGDAEDSVFELGLQKGYPIDHANPSTGASRVEQLERYFQSISTLYQAKI